MAKPTTRYSTVKSLPVTSAIIAANTLVFLAMVFSGVSATSPQIADLARWGADTGYQTLIAQPWRMLTSTYVHIGIVHILLNMWCLWNLGLLAEGIFDRWTYLLTYTFCGLAGSLASLAVHPTRVGAGASGAIFGLAGALIAALYLGSLPVSPRALRSTLKSLISFAGYNLFFGAVVPSIDNAAHLGGLLGGLLLGAAVARHLGAKGEESALRRRWIFVAAGLVFFLLFRALRRSALGALGPGPPL
jgi:rhomboid protease GluP